jgi:hypothetical protein
MVRKCDFTPSQEVRAVIFYLVLCEKKMAMKYDRRKIRASFVRKCTLDFVREFLMQASLYAAGLCTYCRQPGRVVLSGVVAGQSTASQASCCSLLGPFVIPRQLATLQAFLGSWPSFLPGLLSPVLEGSNEPGTYLMRMTWP